jgi:hypothetical protein
MGKLHRNNEGIGSGPFRKIMPTGLGFVLEVKQSKKYLKSFACKKNRHEKCSGKRAPAVHTCSAYPKCQCPCHNLVFDPDL